MIFCKYRGASHRACILKYSIPKETSVDFSNGLNDELAKCLKINLIVYEKILKNAKPFQFQ